MTRLDSGRLVDRSRPLAFRFDGRQMTGFAGDTLASALLANGVKLVGRSFKYHRPRGILTAGLEEPSALVTVRSGARAEPNVSATRVELYDGLEAFSQNCWPSPRHDVLAINGLLAPVFVAGFYYKTFMWPASLWERVYEPLIRRAAGLGRLSTHPDPDSYDRSHAFVDVLVVGGGPAGLSAALAAGRTGSRVLLVEDDMRLGGRLLSQPTDVAGIDTQQWLERTTAELETLPNVRVLTRTTVFGAYDGSTFGAIERVADHQSKPRDGQPRQRYWKIVSGRAVIATGAIERPIGFGGNDRPGVMMASAIQTYIHRFGVAPGRRAAIFANDASGYDVASDLLSAGIDVVAIVDPRAENTLSDCGIPVIRGEVVATAGKVLKNITVRTVHGSRKIGVDLLGMAGGWDPAIGLVGHLGLRPTWSKSRQGFLAEALPGGVDVVGAAAGHSSLLDAIASGEDAVASDGAFRSRRRLKGSLAERPPLIVAGCRQKAFVDFQNDVTVGDVELAEREGYRSIEHLKRYTTLGMATDQGKAGQILGHAVLAHKSARDIAEIGTIATRPPYTPVALAALAGFERGLHLRPTRLSAVHAWAQEQEADCVEAALWKRPQWYRRPGDIDWLSGAMREAATVRTAVGFCDVSTLGKIEVCGSDAHQLIDRLYANTMSSLPVGKCRYGLMLREDGFVFDDGTVARLERDRFVLTTTTANAAAVMQHVDFALQVLWPDLDACAASVTEQWAQIAVAGPCSRALLEDLLGADLSGDEFPFMAAGLYKWKGTAVRVFRLSFSGELAYEVAVPSGQGEVFVRELAAFGHKYGCQPYGLEALNILRIEKGHPAGGELNGQVTAADLGMGRLLSSSKDYVGRALAEREVLRDPARPCLIGLRAVNQAECFTAGSHLIAARSAMTAANDEGHVSSVCCSPALDAWIGLGFLMNGQNRIGERLIAASPVRNRFVEVEICRPCFVDPEGQRLRG